MASTAAGGPTRTDDPHRRFGRLVPGLGPGGEREVEDLAHLERVLASGVPLGGLRFQGLDLTAAAPTLLDRDDLQGLVVLGGVLTPELDEHLRTHGAIIFPSDPAAPVRPYRGTLYTADELYSGLDQHGYAHTPDARAYVWAEDAALRHDAYVSVLRAIHDDAMADALVPLVTGRRVVGVMGGHALQRGTEEFARTARLGHALAERGCLVATGGGPGAMEAANLGAWSTDEEVLEGTLAAVAEVPDFEPDIGPWALAALRARRAAAADERSDPLDVRSIGIPTWHYGHEPPNVFGDRIAKFFSNALREDLLLHHSTAGMVVIPGAAGTVQEVFQMATRMYYEVDGRIPPLVLVDRAHWTGRLPVWPLLQELAADRPMAAALHLVDTTEAAVDLLSG